MKKKFDKYFLGGSTFVAGNIVVFQAADSNLYTLIGTTVILIIIIVSLLMYLFFSKPKISDEEIQENFKNGNKDDSLITIFEMDNNGKIEEKAISQEELFSDTVSLEEFYGGADETKNEAKKTSVAPNDSDSIEEEKAYTIEEDIEFIKTVEDPNVYVQKQTLNEDQFIDPKVKESKSTSIVLKEEDILENETSSLDEEYIVYENKDVASMEKILDMEQKSLDVVEEKTLSSNDKFGYKAIEINRDLDQDELSIIKEIITTL